MFSFWIKLIQVSVKFHSYLSSNTIYLFQRVKIFLWIKFLIRINQLQLVDNNSTTPNLNVKLVGLSYMSLPPDTFSFVMD